MTALVQFGFFLLRRLLQISCALAIVLALKAAAAVDTSTNAQALPELLEKWNPIALPEVQRAAQAGDMHAMHYLGYSYETGLRVPQDINQSLAWYQRGMKAGYLPSANEIGNLYLRGSLGSNGVAQAVYHYSYAAERGYPGAQANLGMLYRDGTGVPQDLTQALHWFRLAAAQQQPTAMVEVGRSYRFGRAVKINLNEAAHWFEMAAQTKEPALAQLNLGLLYEDQGQIDKAVPWYEQAAGQGSVDAMVQLYLCYWRGKGVPVDHDKAIEWLTQAGTAGDPYSQSVLGDFYGQSQWKGDGQDRRWAAPNWSQAFYWSQLSAQQNWAGGQYHLAMLYVRGRGVERDEARGLELMRAAADQGLDAAVHGLASLYAQGIGVPRDESEKPINLLRRSKSWEELMRRYELGFGTDRDIFAAAECYCEITQLEAPYYRKYTLDDKIDFQPGKHQNAFTSLEVFDERGTITLALPWEDGSDDLRHALSLYLKSATGHGESALQIGNCYLKAQNAPQSNFRAWAWFKIAAQNGAVEAQPQLKSLETQMSASELKAGEQERVRQVSQLRRFASKL